MPTPQQSTTSSNIFGVYLKGLRYAILLALCQAGKTGAFQELIRMMLADGIIERVYIVCGSNETELRDQAHADTKKANPVAYAEGRITVIFRQDFDKTTMDITNSLIVAEESHLDQGRDMMLDRFLRKHGLTMDGNPATLIEKNAFILSVDATPYSELAALAHKQTPFAKHIEFLEAGPSYYGLADYKFQGRINETFDIASDPAAFARLFKPAKWALMRLSSGKKADAQEVAIKQVCAAKGYRVLYFTAQREEMAITDLEHAPSVPTAVIVRGRLRAGKVVCKKHIAFVWEGAATSKTDSLVQGLLGRMCGYEFGEEKPMIFVPSSALKEYEHKVVTASELGRAIMGPLVLPTKGTNLKKPHVANRGAHGRTQCPPLRLRWPSAHDEWTPMTEMLTDAEVGRCCKDFLLARRAIVDDCAYLSHEQKTEINGFLATATPHTRRLTARTSAPSKSYFGAVIEGYETQTATAENVSDSPHMTFFVAHDRCGVRGANPQDLYVIFYTQARGLGGGMGHAHLKSRIPMASEKCIFTQFKGHMDVPIVAAGLVGFKAAALKGPAELSAALSEYIMLQRTTVDLSLTRRIADVGKAFNMSKPVFAYKSTKDNEVARICDRLSREHSIDIKVKYARGSAAADGHFNITEITW